MNKLPRCIALLLVITCLFVPSAQAESTTDLHKSIHGLLEMLFEDLYYYKIEGNDSGYIIRFAEEGAAVSTILTAMGTLSRDKWQSYIDSTVAWANSISNLIAECGVKNPNVLVVLVDDFEMKETLLAIYNGTVIFDYAPAK